MVVLKRAIVKEEFVAITGNFLEALLVNQLLYWTDRCEDIDKYITEERMRANSFLGSQALAEHLEFECTNGWIYKKAEEIAGEVMTGHSAKRIRDALKSLESKGFVTSRRNPKYAWDKCLQYRVNTNAISSALFAKGYTLQGYKLCAIEPSKSTLRTFKNGDGTFKNGDGIVENFAAVPENTSESTPEIPLYIPSPAQKPTASSHSTQSNDDEIFNRFWSEYPRKTAKQAAVKAWKKLNPNDTTFKAILDGLTRYKKTPDWLKDNGQFIPHPATFLNGRRWEDEIATAPKQAANQPSLPDASSAWDTVLEAVRKYGHPREVEAMQKLPPTIREAVKVITFRAICMSDRPDIIKAQFFKAYADAQQKDK